jgi:hypothetical protein
VEKREIIKRRFYCTPYCCPNVVGAMQNLMFKKDSDFGGGTYVKEATCKNKA